MTDTLQQRRATHALNEVRKVNTDKKKYAALARGFPMLIRTDGLAPALTFLYIKHDEHGLLLLAQISGWVTNCLEMKPGRFLDELRNCDFTKYRTATVEAIAYTVWLKRFTEAQGWGDAPGSTL